MHMHMRTHTHTSTHMCMHTNTRTDLQALLRGPVVHCLDNGEEAGQLIVLKTQLLCTWE